MEWKYIVYKSGKVEVPIIFPNHLVHSMVADAMRQYVVAEANLIGREWSFKVVSAGTVEMGGAVMCSGKSESLGLESRPIEDSRLIGHYHFSGGYVG